MSRLGQIARSFNPFPDPKKGKGRSVLHRLAKTKTKAWKAVPYLRDKHAIKTQNMDRVAWKRIGDFLMASDDALVKLFHADGPLPDWIGARCPYCQKGKLSKLQAKAGERMPKHRCNFYGCHTICIPSSWKHVVAVIHLSKLNVLCFSCFSTGFQMLPFAASCTPTTKPLRTWRSLGRREREAYGIWQWQDLDGY